MKLATYLKRKNMTAKAFAIRLGVAPSTIWRIAVEEAVPRMPLARKIKRETRGAVGSFEDFLPRRSIPGRPAKANLKREVDG